jgi:Arylsulfotransferase (ASST)
VPGAGRVTEFVIQEVDVGTGEVLFEWHSADHVPLSASYVERPRNGSSWDYFHGNSIEPPAPGGHEIIVSARNTSAVYGIDRRTGAVRWTLGGKRDQFGLVRRHPSWRFCAQHDARRLANGDIMLFDNGGAGRRDGVGCPVHPARVQWFRLDRPGRRARVVRTISSRPFSPTGRGYFPPAVGSARVQPNANTLISWGTTPRVTEVTHTGRVVFALRLQAWTYRAVRARWRGFPLGRPALAARRHAGAAVDLWASWNGATQIRRWRVLAGRTATGLRPLAQRFQFTDLETRMTVRTRARFVAVAALNARGRELGRSAAVRVTR